MARVYKNKRCLKAFILIVLVVFATSGLAANADSGRIMPGGKVLIYRGDQQVGELTAEAPFPNGALLACEGDCAARMDGLLLVAADKSLFSVTTRASSRELLVTKGTVYFTLSKLPHSLVFVTPKGVVTAQQLMLNASADGGLLKGYVAVTGESAEIGVIEGGTMVVSTVAGSKTVQSGNKLVLTQTDGVKTPEEGATAQAETGTAPGGAAGGGATEGVAAATAGSTAAGVGGGVSVVPIIGVAAVVLGVGIAAANAGGGGGEAASQTAP